MLKTKKINQRIEYMNHFEYNERVIVSKDSISWFMGNFIEKNKKGFLVTIKPGYLKYDSVFYYCHKLFEISDIANCSYVDSYGRIKNCIAEIIEYTIFNDEISGICKDISNNKIFKSISISPAINI